MVLHRPIELAGVIGMWEFGLDEPQISALSETGEGKMFEEWVEEASVFGS